MILLLFPVHEKGSAIALPLIFLYFLLISYFEENVSDRLKQLRQKLQS